MELTGNTFCFAWEAVLIEWLQGHIGPAGISLLSFFSAFGEELLIIVILGFLYWGWDKEFAKFVGLNVLMANVWNAQIKNIVLRRRPYMDHERIRILRVVEPDADPMNIARQGYSFPSGHSSGAAALYGSIAVRGRKRVLTVLGVLLPFLVGLSRVVVGAHYPTDVLAGWLLGAAAFILVPFLQRRIGSRMIFCGVMLLTALPGLFFCRSTDYFTSLGLLLGFMAAVPLEERFVKFKNTRSPIRVVLRILGGMAVFFGMNILLKLPFSAAFSDSGSMAALLVRCLRYFLIMVTEFTLYPLLFGICDRRKNRKDENLR